MRKNKFEPRCASKEGYVPWSGLRAALQRALHPAPYALATILLLAGCGGGSSGTGESEQLGQVVDRACQPIGSLDMGSIGIATVAPLSGEDGSFSLAPTSSNTIRIPDETSGSAVDLSAPLCILVVYDGGEIVAVNTYPFEELLECSIEGVRATVPAENLPPCG